MTTATRTKPRKPKVLHDGQNLLSGWIVSWTMKGGETKFSLLKSALSAAGLDPSIVNERKPKHAFSRACRKLADERVIDVFKEDDAEIEFQFTARSKDATEIRYKKETMLTLNKTTGDISCPKAELQKLAKEQFDEAMETWTTSDVTRIVQELFDQQADLFRTSDNGGTYFVPQMYAGFLGNVHTFLQQLGRGLRRWPVASGTAEGDRSITEIVTSSIAETVAELKEAVESFGLDTRTDVLERRAEQIKRARFKVECYAAFLSEAQGELKGTLEEAGKKLAQTIEEVSKARAEKDGPKDQKWVDAGKKAAETRKRNMELAAKASKN